METYLDCVPCFFKQALDAARLAGADSRVQKQILLELSGKLENFSFTDCPPLMGRFIYQLVAKITGKADPFKKLKDKSNKLALSFYPELKEKARTAKDPLLLAVELAIAGNIIDYGVKNNLDIDKEVDDILSKENEAIQKESKAIFNYPEFFESLKKAKSILYIGDNAGEVVFDRVLIEQIKEIYPDKKIIYAVKERPIINDVLAEDAYFCGIDKRAQIISSGSDAPGTIFSLCRKEFLEVLKTTDMVISKGQGNFESLSNEGGRDIFFLFMAKCQVVAKHLNCKIKDIILFHSRP